MKLSKTLGYVSDQNKKYFISLIAIFFFVQTLFAVGIQEKPSNENLLRGKIVVLLTDHREAIDDFNSLVVEIDKIRFHKKSFAPEKGWVAVDCKKQLFDLTKYKDGKLFQLVEVELSEGNYDAIELLISEAYGTPKGQSELGVPVDIGIVRTSFVVSPQQTLKLILDLTVLDVSDHPGEKWLIILKEIRKEVIGWIG